LAFQVMVGAGLYLILLGFLAGFLAWRGRSLVLERWYLWMVIVGGPMGLIAIQAGWIVTEVGRQPWVIYGIMRTKDAVTPMPGLVVPFLMFSLLYLVLGIVVIALLKRQVFASPKQAEILALEAGGSSEQTADEQEGRDVR
jgi:cytochrome d ubiquinol oxidase subunit I